MTKQEFLAMSLPYGLKCQYECIITFERELINIEDLKLNRSTNYKYSYKIGLLKQVHVFKKYWIARCGIKHKGLKVFYNGKGLYPVLRPLSDLTKEIEHKGEKFVPIEKLREIIGGGWCEVYERAVELMQEWYIGTLKDKIKYLPFEFIQLFISWHFDIADLISTGEAIDVNTLDVNPYK